MSKTWSGHRLRATIAGLLAVAGFVFPFASAQAQASAGGEVRAQTLLIDEEDRVAFGIKEVRWVEASGSVPAHAFILGCHACGPASYTSSDELAEPASLPRIPTSYILRIPESYNARLLANIPPGASTQTFFRPRHRQLLADGYAVAVIIRCPGSPGFPTSSSSAQRFRPPITPEASLRPGTCCAIFLPS